MLVDGASVQILCICSCNKMACEAVKACWRPWIFHPLSETARFQYTIASTFTWAITYVSTALICWDRKNTQSQILACFIFNWVEAIHVSYVMSCQLTLERLMCIQKNFERDEVFESSQAVAIRDRYWWCYATCIILPNASNSVPVSTGAYKFGVVKKPSLVYSAIHRSGFNNFSEHEVLMSEDD